MASCDRQWPKPATVYLRSADPRVTILQPLISILTSVTGELATLVTNVNYEP